MICLHANAWKRRHYSDREVLGRSALVVVGRIDPASLELSAHADAAGGGASWEHHCQLIISTVLKGTNVPHSLSISIHYGLEPIVGGFKSNQFGLWDIRGTATTYATDVVEIVDIAGSPATLRPISGDIRTNHIWLLRSEAWGSASNRIGIHDPDDIQPLGRRAVLENWINWTGK